MVDVSDTQMALFSSETTLLASKKIARNFSMPNEHEELTIAFFRVTSWILCAGTSPVGSL